MENIKLKLGKARLLLAAIMIVTFISCGGGTSKQTADAKGFTAIEKEIKNKFGDNAYYTDLTITYLESTGNIIALTVTDAPEYLKMGQWQLSQDNWLQNSEISLEVPEGNEAADFMFQLNDKINLIKLGELAEKSMQQLTAEKNIESPSLYMALIKFPKNGDQAKTQYIIRLKPENGGTTFTFIYTLNGELIEMDY